MNKEDLKDIKGITYYPMNGMKGAKFIGKPVLFIDRVGFAEYGIITGFVNNLVEVHFAYYPNPKRINPHDLFIPVVNRVSISL